MEKLKLIIVFSLMTFVIGAVLVWISNKSNRQRNDRVTYVERNYKYSKGIILKKYSYKGHVVEVKYRIGNTNYEYSGGWDRDPNRLREGDSISFKYSIDSPGLIITELENNYFNR